MNSDRSYAEDQSRAHRRSRQELGKRLRECYDHELSGEVPDELIELLSLADRRRCKVPPEA